jgi:hypothetical protein
VMIAYPSVFNILFLYNEKSLRIDYSVCATELICQKQGNIIL